MGRIRTKIFSNGTTTITAATDSDPPFDFSAAKSGTIVVRAVDFGNLDNTLVVDVYWGVRQRGLLANKANLTFAQDTGLTVTITAGAATSTPRVGVLPITQMKSPHMKVVFTPAGTTKAVKVEAYFEQVT